MPRVSDIDDAFGISTHHMFLSNCVVQVMYSAIVLIDDRIFLRSRVLYITEREFY